MNGLQTFLRRGEGEGEKKGRKKKERKKKKKDEQRKKDHVIKITTYHLQVSIQRTIKLYI